MNEMLRSAMNGHRRQGKNEMVKHLQGVRLTQRQAIKAKCYDCVGMGEDNICESDECAIHPYSPYRVKC